MSARTAVDSGRSVVLDTIRDEGGELLGFAKVTRDVTERQQAHQTLLESERRYRRLVEAVVDYAIYQLDPDGFVSTWNTGAQRIKGYAPEEIIGQHFSCFYTEEDRAAGVPAGALARAAQEERYEAEGWRLRKDGTRFWASVVIDRIADDSGALVGFAKVTRDITERLEAQQKLRQTQAQLARRRRWRRSASSAAASRTISTICSWSYSGTCDTVRRQAKLLGDERRNWNVRLPTRRGAPTRGGLDQPPARLFATPGARSEAVSTSIQFITGSVEFLQRSLGELVEIEAVGAPGLWLVEVDANHLETGDPQPGDQRARCDADRRQAHHRGRKRVRGS